MWQIFAVIQARMPNGGLHAFSLVDDQVWTSTDSYSYGESNSPAWSAPSESLCAASVGERFLSVGPGASMVPVHAKRVWDHISPTMFRHPCAPSSVADTCLMSTPSRGRLSTAQPHPDGAIGSDRWFCTGSPRSGSTQRSWFPRLPPAQAGAEVELSPNPDGTLT